MFSIRALYLVVALCAFHFVGHIEAFNDTHNFRQAKQSRTPPTYEIEGKAQDVENFRRTYGLLKTFSENKYILDQLSDNALEQYIDQLVDATHKIQIPQELRAQITAVCSQTFTKHNLRACYQEAVARCAAEKQPQKSAAEPVVSPDTSDNASKPEPTKNTFPTSSTSPSFTAHDFERYKEESPPLYTIPNPHTTSATSNHAVPQQTPAFSKPANQQSREGEKRARQSSQTPSLFPAQREIKKEKPTPQPDPFSTLYMPKKRTLSRKDSLLVAGTLITVWICILLSLSSKDKNEDDADDV